MHTIQVDASDSHWVWLTMPHTHGIPRNRRRRTSQDVARILGPRVMSQVRAYAGQPNPRHRIRPLSITITDEEYAAMTRALQRICGGPMDLGFSRIG